MVGLSLSCFEQAIATTLCCDAGPLSTFYSCHLTRSLNSRNQWGTNRSRLSLTEMEAKAFRVVEYDSGQALAVHYRMKVPCHRSLWLCPFGISDRVLSIVWRGHEPVLSTMPWTRCVSDLRSSGDARCVQLQGKSRGAGRPEQPVFASWQVSGTQNFSSHMFASYLRAFATARRLPVQS